MATRTILLYSLKAIWLIICITIFWRFINDPLVFDNQERTVLFVLIMLVMTFPLGMVAWIFLSIQSLLIPDIFFRKEVDIFIRWLCLTITGYIQWFVLVPWLYKKRRARASGVEPS